MNKPAFCDNRFSYNPCGKFTSQKKVLFSSFVFISYLKHSNKQFLGAEKKKEFLSITPPYICLFSLLRLPTTLVNKFMFYLMVGYKAGLVGVYLFCSSTFPSNGLLKEAPLKLFL